MSDGKDSIERNLEVAAGRGLTMVGCVDHVRADTGWVPEFVAAVDHVASTTNMRVLAGLESKMLDTEGNLDLPADSGIASFVAIADHAVPTPDGPCDPREVRSQLERGDRSAAEVVSDLLVATAAAAHGCRRSLIVHLFSVLPKVGLAERDVSDDQLRALADELRSAGAIVEISERWRCPSERTIAVLSSHGVPIVLGSDSHQASKIGQFSYASNVAERLPSWNPAPGLTHLLS